MSNNWRRLWSDKRLDGDAPTITKLIELVGWKSETGGLPAEDWLDYIDYVMERLTLKPGENVLEVGCGPGGFLLPLYQQGYSVSGIDYSESLLQICRELMPNGSFRVAEANSLPFDDQAFDVIISNSVFHYFFDHQYTESVIREIVRCLKRGGRGAVLDLNDAAKCNEFMAQRYARYGGRKEYNRQNSNLPQLFYDKHWLIDLGQKYGLSGYVDEQQIRNYLNSTYRFNYFFERRTSQL